jgi:hypothetical protein
MQRPVIASLEHCCTALAAAHGKFCMARGFKGLVSLTLPLHIA